VDGRTTSAIGSASEGRPKMGEAVLKHTVLQPSAALRPFVKRFESVHSFSDRTHTLLPDTSLVACFRLGGVALHGASALPPAGISGLQYRARTVTHLAGSHVLLTVFTEAGAAARASSSAPRTSVNILIPCLRDHTLHFGGDRPSAAILTHNGEIVLAGRLRMLDPFEFPAGSVLGPYRSTGDWFEPGVQRDGG